MNAYTVNDGNSGGNYSVTTNTAAGTISAAGGVSATVTIAAKTYNAGTGATISGCTLTGVSGDVACSHGSATATFADANAGTGKTVNVTGLTLTGTDAGNYTFNGNATATATIDPAALTINAVTDSKAYDGNTASTGVPTVSGLLGSDTVTGKAQVFDSATAGSRTLSVSAYTINDGNSGNNYTVTTTTAAGSITLNGLADSDVTVTIGTKTYDGTTTATITNCTIANTITGVTCDASGATAAFQSRNAGSAKAVDVTGLKLTGPNAANYNFDGAVTSDGTITKAPLTVSAVTGTKTYDGTTASTGTPTVTGVKTGDTVTGCTQAFDSRNAGTTGGRTLTVSGCTVNDGNSGANYDLTTNTATGTINKAGLTLAAVSATKAYDGTTASTGTPTVTGVKTGDTVTGVAQTYSSADAGTRTLTVTAYTVDDGNSGANYTVTTTTATGTITPASQTISVGTAAPGSAPYGTTFTVTASGGASGNPVAITVSGGCTGSGNGTATIVMTSGTNACTVNYNQAAGTNYSAAPKVTTITTAAKAASTTTGQPAGANPVAAGTAVQVTWTVTATNPGPYTATPTGTVTVSSTLTSTAKCSATVTAGSCSLTLTKAGADTLTISYGGSANYAVSTATANQTVNPGALVGLAVSSTGSTTVTAGTGQAFTATGADKYGNALSTSPSGISYSITNGTCSLNVCRSTKAGNQTVTAISGTIKGTTTVTIVADVPAKIAFTKQPGKTKVNTAISPAPAVTIQDQWGNTVLTATNQVTVQLGSNPTGATLSGTLVVNAVNGVATFTDLKLNKVGKAYTLQASSPDFITPVLFGTTSNKFDIG